ncbi:MarR family transcriptional regulator [Streptomyces yangpuensis]|uniref:MarR family transcriptional regulator n=1 Tax=Streptomyces yangpuensis TaxID=1648182 RepID=UPI003648B5F9
MTNTQAPALTETQQKALAALADHRGATSREIAEYAGIGGSTANKALAALESSNLAHRELGERDGARKTAARWYPVDPDIDETEEAPAEAESPAAAPEPDTAAPAAEAPTAAPEPPAKAPKATGRLGRGDLRQKVYEHLEAHPGKAFTAPALAKALGRSAGAVANALAKLKDHGQADLIGESPRRYQLHGQA